MTDTIPLGRQVTLDDDALPGEARVIKAAERALSRRDVDLKRRDSSSPSYRMLYEAGASVPIIYSSRFHHLANPSRPIVGAVSERDTFDAVMEHYERWAKRPDAALWFSVAWAEGMRHAT